MTKNDENHEKPENPKIHDFWGLTGTPRGVPTPKPWFWTTFWTTFWRFLEVLMDLGSMCHFMA